MSTQTESPRLSGETVKYRNTELMFSVTKTQQPFVVSTESLHQERLVCVGGIFPSEEEAREFIGEFAVEWKNREGRHVRG